MAADLMRWGGGGAARIVVGEGSVSGGDDTQTDRCDETDETEDDRHADEGDHGVMEDAQRDHGEAQSKAN
jgi:hypothetical protein